MELDFDLISIRMERDSFEERGNFEEGLGVLMRRSVRRIEGVLFFINCDAKGKWVTLQGGTD